MHERRREFEELSRTKMNEVMRKDPYINALQIKYGYALTGHKSQGGQWKKVIVCFEGKMPGMTDLEYRRWAYTACTRAEEELMVVGFPFKKM